MHTVLKERETGCDKRYIAFPGTIYCSMEEERLRIINQYPEETDPQKWQQLAERSSLMLREFFKSEKAAEKGETCDECDLHTAVP